jgi:5-methylcytosine-specific restriction endonuclease McrA
MELTREQTRAKTGCPTCGAKQFEPCFQRKGRKKRRATNHWERIKLAIKLEKKAPQKPTKRKCASPHKADSFYSSWAWKQVRYEALSIHGRRCQCCGWQPGDTPHGHLVVDHIKPRRRFPDLELCVDNLQVLCNDCNMGKGAVHQDDFRTLEDWFSNLLRE